MEKLTRHDALKALVLPALAVAIGGTTAIADAKASKAALKYQTHPNGGAKCETCKLFIRGKNTASMGTCKVVAGPISPQGWCVAYTKK